MPATRFQCGIWWECIRPGAWQARSLPLRCVRMFRGMAAEQWEVYMLRNGEEAEMISAGLTLGCAINDLADSGIRMLINASR